MALAVDAKRVAGRISFWLVIATLAGAFALSNILTVFQIYDDEGYLLLSIAHYLSGGRLYTDTFTQYGPFYYFAQSIFFRLLGFPVSHDGGRLVLLVYWLASGLLAGLFIKKISRSLLLGAAAGLGCVTSSAFLVNEPGHPQQLVLLLWMAASNMALPGSSGLAGSRLFFLGAIGAALFFTKVNVGIFYMAALAGALVCVLKPGWVRWFGISLLVLYAIAAPPFLMHSNLKDEVEAYCLVAILCGTSTFVFGFLARPASPFSARTPLYTAAGLITAGLVIVFLGLLQGISGPRLVQGVLLSPMNHPLLYYIPLDIGILAVLFAAVIVLGLWYLWVWQQKTSGPNVAAAVDFLKCVIGIATGLIVLIDFQRGHWMLAFLPLTLLHGARSFSAAELFPRVFVTSLTATEFLVAYPVAGSQLGQVRCLQLLWAFLCTADGTSGLTQVWRERAAQVSQRKLQLGSVISGVLLLAAAGKAAVSIGLRNFPPASSLPGSSLLHLRPDQERDYEFLSHSIAANCSILFTMPGMGSFNFWSGVPTPNGWNVTIWMKLLDSGQQQQILAQLRSMPEACVIYNPTLVAMWHTSQQELRSLPLAEYILAEMQKVTSTGGYEIRVHPERAAAWRHVENVAERQYGSSISLGERLQRSRLVVPPAAGDAPGN
jgi:hypothetical protein